MGDLWSAFGGLFNTAVLKMGLLSPYVGLLSRKLQRWLIVTVIIAIIYLTIVVNNSGKTDVEEYKKLVQHPRENTPVARVGAPKSPGSNTPKSRGPNLASLPADKMDPYQAKEDKIKVRTFNENFYSYEVKKFWKEIGHLVSDEELYPRYFNVNIVLNKMATSRITHVRAETQGTAYKWLLVLDSQQYILFKPQLVEPAAEKKIYCNGGHEQPRYEVAAFHLMRLMGIRTVPFVAGRRIHIATEILPIAPPEIRNTIKTYDREQCPPIFAQLARSVQPGFKHWTRTLSANGHCLKAGLQGDNAFCLEDRTAFVQIRYDGTACVIHKCGSCKKARQFCFPDGMIDGSMSFWLHQMIHYEFGPRTAQHAFHPISKLENEFRYNGVNDQRHCNFVRTLHLYNVTRYFLDLVDTAILDHVLANMDQKHTYIIDRELRPGLTVHLDHGLAFCEIETTNVELLLAPVYQCCRIRQKTMTGMSRAYPTLKRDFLVSTAHDQLYPLLRDYQLDGVLHRMKNVLKKVGLCQAILEDSAIFGNTG